MMLTSGVGSNAVIAALRAEALTVAPPIRQQCLALFLLLVSLNKRKYLLPYKIHAMIAVVV